MAVCRAGGRQRARAAAFALGCDHRVIKAEVAPPDDEPTPCWTVEAELRPQCGGVPPDLLAEFSSRGLTLRYVRRRGEFWNAVATV